MELKSRILENQYHDSVALMLATKQLKNHPNVSDAALMMGTEVNKELLKQGGLLTEEAQAAQANDLIITVKCENKTDNYLDEAETLLARKPHGEQKGAAMPQTLRSAVRTYPDLNLAVISIAGAYAAREAREALASGLHVLLFSDNVSLEDEIALKKFALQQNLLLMGPGAGTAIINGVGLGFANAVARGNIGIVSAAGTGLQEVSTLISKQGAGISQAIGTGGRDLSKHVGGLTFFAAIDALQADPRTKVMALISKPPDEEVTKKLLEKVNSSKKKVVLCLLGADLSSKKGGNLHFTRTLEECAYTAAALARKGEPDVAKVIQQEDEKLQPLTTQWKGKFSPKQHLIRGLFSGGTLCYEAQVVCRDALTTPVYSNAPLEKKHRLKDASHSQGHCAIDLGEEEFTVGRPHPMIDNDLRIQRMRQEASDPKVAVIMLDVIIGYGAHPDPATELGEAIKQLLNEAEEIKRKIAFVASVTGTENDPQVLSRSVEMLEKAGVVVCGSNAQAARLAAALVEG